MPIGIWVSGHYGPIVVITTLPRWGLSSDIYHNIFTRRNQVYIMLGLLFLSSHVTTSDMA